MSLDTLLGRNGQALAARLGTELQVHELRKLVTSADASAAVQQVGTVTVGAAQNSTLYSLNVSVPAMSVPITVSYTSDGSATTTEIAAGLTAALVANAVTDGLLTATSASNVLTYTVKRPGQVLTLTSTAASAGDLTLAVGTAAASGGSITFGRWVSLTSFDATKGLWAASAPALPAKATFTLLATYAASSTYVASPIVLNIHTGATSAPNLTWAAGASASAMAGNAETAIESTISGSSVATTVDGSNVTIVITLPWPNEFSAYSIVPAASGGAGTEDLRHTTSTGCGASPRGGVAMDYGVTPAPSFGTSATATAAGAAVPVFETGGIVVVEDPGATVTAGSAVYVETTSGATQRRFYTASSATRFAAPRARWVQGNIPLADGTTGATIELE